MRNIKIEDNLIGDEWWPHIAVVEVPGSAGEKVMPAGLEQPEKEGVIQSWQKVAVLLATPKVPFRIGFIADNGKLIQFLKAPIKTINGKFGMRVGAEATKFFVMPEDLATNMRLELVKVVEESDIDYKDLPLY